MDHKVQTTFEILDQASGPLKQMEKGAENFKATAEAAQSAAKGIGAVSTSAAATAPPTAGGAPGAPPGDEAALVRGLTKAQRAEMQARRARTIGLRMEQAEGRVTERATSQLSGLMGQAGGVWGAVAGKVEQIAGVAESTGFQMSAFGGTMGKVGPKIAAMAGQFGAVASAAAGGYALGTVIDNGIGTLSAFFGGSGRSLSMMLAFEKSTQQADRANYFYAQSLGFRSAVEMAATQESKKKFQATLDSARMMEKATRDLGAMPTNKTSEAMNLWHDALVKKAQDLAKTSGRKQEEIEAELTKALEGSAQAVQTNALSAAKLSVAQEAAVLKIDALPYGASLEAQQAHINQVHAEVVRMEAAGAIHAQDMAATETLLLAKTESLGSIESMAERQRMQADADAEMELAVRQLSKSLPKVHEGLTTTIVEQAAYNEAVKKATLLYAAANPTASAEQVKTFAGKLQTSKPPHVDFRGSRFDIKQAFAKDFDPDRIAVAFTSDLVGLGERRIQSGQAPVFGSR